MPFFCVWRTASDRHVSTWGNLAANGGNGSDRPAGAPHGAAMPRHSALDGAGPLKLAFYFWPEARGSTLKAAVEATL